MPSELVQKIIEIAEEAGKLLLSYYKKETTTDFKNNDAFDPVTTADKEADKLIRERLSTIFPNDEVLSEENEYIPSDYSKRIWMVDPLDGTKEFIKQTGGFAVNIGLWSQGQILLGVVCAPVFGRVFFAERGQGAYEKMADGTYKKLHVSSVTDLKHVRLLTRTMSAEPKKRPLDAIVDKLSVKEKDENSKIKICRIACGEAEAHLNTNPRLSKWDTLGPELILEEAGGVVTDIDGKPLDYTQPSLRWERSVLVANNQRVHKEILSLIRANRGTHEQ